MSGDAQTTFARATLAEAIFETSRLSDCNAVVVRTAETAEALLALTSRCEMTDASLLVGLRIQLERTKDVPCGVCGQTVVVIGKGAGPHVASLNCASCYRHRGWLPKTIADFLVGTISRFGWPPEPITIRNPKFAQANTTAPLGARAVAKSAP
jgi:hypothetical protein